MPTKRRFILPVSTFARQARWLLLTLVVASIAPSAAAQQYRVDPVDAEARRSGGIATIHLKNRERYAAERTRFEEFFTKAYFPQMTRSSTDDLAGLGDARFNLFRRYLWNTNNEQLQQHLTKLAYDYMLRVVAQPNPPYHPAVRYNAVLILGMLDQQYAIEGRRPPKPLPEATEVLTRIVDVATTSDRFPPPVVLGAVIGLERHSQYRDALAPGAVDKMTAALLKLVNHEQPIQDMDRDAYAWLRFRAASVLAQLGGVGPNNEVHNALVKLVADSRSLDDRCEAAALLAKIDYEGAQVDGAAAAETYLELARDLAAEEAKRAQDFEDANVGGGGFAPSRGAYMLDAYGEREAFPRRHVLARLTLLRTGLRAVKSIAPEEEQTKIDAVIAAINPVISAAANKDTTDLNLTPAIRTMAGAIDLAATPAEKPAAEEPEQ